MGEPEVVGKTPLSGRYAGLRPAQPGEVRNPTGTNGLHRFSRELREAGCLEDVKRVLKNGMNSKDEGIQLHAAALTLKYILGVPQGEIVEGQVRQKVDWSKLTEEQFQILVAVRNAITDPADADGRGSAPAETQPR